MRENLRGEGVKDGLKRASIEVSDKVSGHQQVEMRAKNSRSEANCLEGPVEGVWAEEKGLFRVCPADCSRDISSPETAPCVIE